MPIAIDDVITGALVNVLALAGRRLSVAAEIYPAQARTVLAQILVAGGASASADGLVGYYDDQICALVARVEADEPAVLAQIRDEALATRMINILHAIERHAAALAARPDWDIDNYRRHVTIRHGRLEPPDFQRRRPIPIDRIYVPTAITEEPSAERTGVSPHQTRTLDAWGLATRLDRTVLLGDPGGGKTTASNVLMHHFASTPAGLVPLAPSDSLPSGKPWTWTAGSTTSYGVRLTHLVRRGRRLSTARQAEYGEDGAGTAHRRSPTTSRSSANT